MKIGLISDTHSFLDNSVFDYFKECDEIWHAGDFGNVSVYDQLNAFKPTIGVYGNIDGQDVRIVLKEDLFFEREGVKIYMTHIGGSPGKYSARVKEQILNYKPAVFVCGHSHILRIMSDPAYGNMLYLNPGAAGKEGFHKIRTIMRFEFNAGKIEKLQVIELGMRGK
ncbi:MAG: metallophosphoesterase family protein [Cytophaga sp.]|uniref:metallophosphoesterase family protein n=1 Tax=Cytophaga sp. TaxID=29535 RepID=UPI003F80DF5E